MDDRGDRPAGYRPLASCKGGKPEPVRPEPDIFDVGHVPGWEVLPAAELRYLKSLQR